MRGNLAGMACSIAPEIWHGVQTRCSSLIRRRRLLPPGDHIRNLVTTRARRGSLAGSFGLGVPRVGYR